MSDTVLVPFINYLAILDNDGERVISKYFDGRGNSEQVANELSLFKKTKAVSARNEAEISMSENEIVVFKSGSDCKFFVSGPTQENELILVGILEVIFDTVSSLLRGQVDKRTMLDNLELVLLTIDEALDHGQIMEIDSNAVCSRVMMRAAEAQPQQMSDMSISQALGIAKDNFIKSIGSSKGGNEGY